MTNKGGHYEQAFQAYLDQRQLPYVTISQARKAILHGTPQKSFDFIVHKPKGSALLIDIKGRKLKSSSFQKSKSGQNWVTNDDVESMLQWQTHFGSDHIPLFVFAYWIFDQEHNQNNASFQHNSRHYWFIAIDVADYQAVMTTRSPKWKTVHLTALNFRHLSKPFDFFLS